MFSLHTTPECVFYIRGRQAIRARDRASAAVEHILWSREKRMCSHRSGTPAVRARERASAAVARSVLAGVKDRDDDVQSPLRYLVSHAHLYSGEYI